jgi:hypothetical protein
MFIWRIKKTRQIFLPGGERVPSMLYEVDVVAEGNSPLDLNRVFSLLSEPQPITKLITASPLGEDIWCDVVGWNEDGPGTAYAVEAEDSGEGVILLIYGGSWGIRLRPEGDPEKWDLTSASQWGEPCLMLGKDTQVKS